MKIETKTVVTVDFMEDFINFLRVRRILESYRNNLQRQDLEITCPEVWISGMFGWDGTPEGHDFWEKVDQEWLEKLRVSKEPGEYKVVNYNPDILEASNLQGKWFHVRDNSWNREATVRQEKLEWEDNTHDWRSMTGGTYLILTKRPVLKKIDWPLSKEMCLFRPFIKVWDDVNQEVRWVLFTGNYCVQETEEE